MADTPGEMWGSSSRAKTKCRLSKVRKAETNRNRLFARREPPTGSDCWVLITGASISGSVQTVCRVRRCHGASSLQDQKPISCLSCRRQIAHTTGCSVSVGSKIHALQAENYVKYKSFPLLPDPCPLSSHKISHKEQIVKCWHRERASPEAERVALEQASASVAPPKSNAPPDQNPLTRRSVWVRNDRHRLACGLRGGEASRHTLKPGVYSPPKTSAMRRTCPPDNTSLGDLRKKSFNPLGSNTGKGGFSTCNSAFALVNTTSD
jgi:hypothetical protein